jgi:EAL domain-containing protein (putative c-di-GMP-specific phosphodiesterase class I)
LRFEGVDIAVQDFGTDETVRSRLWALPVDSLKIARSFIHHLTTDPQMEIAVSSMLILARAFRLGIVAEGVETQEQFDLLVTLGCKQTQGFLHSPPLPMDRFESLLTLNASANAAESQRAVN